MKYGAMNRRTGTTETPSKVKYVFGSSVAVLLVSALFVPVLYPGIREMRGTTPDPIEQTLGQSVEAPTQLYGGGPGPHSAAPSPDHVLRSRPMPIVEGNSSAASEDAPELAPIPSKKASTFLTFAGAQTPPNVDPIILKHDIPPCESCGRAG